MARLMADTCDYCKHCYDKENWSCDIEEPCIGGNMFQPKEEQRRTVAYLETQDDKEYYIEPHRRTITDCEQLAEWLEELKEYKANNYPKCEDCAGCTSWKCDCSNVRNKAIDDFAEKIMEYCSMSDMNKKMIGQIAEQLKEGSAE